MLTLLASGSAAEVAMLPGITTSTDGRPVLIVDDNADKLIALESILLSLDVSS
jgi:hypothetical protein